MKKGGGVTAPASGRWSREEGGRKHSRAQKSRLLLASESWEARVPPGPDGLRDAEGEGFLQVARPGTP